jgi:hypothetical protein
MSTRLPIYLRAHIVKIHTCSYCKAEVGKLYRLKKDWVCLSCHICSRCKKAVEALCCHKKTWVCVSCIDELGGDKKTRPPKKIKDKPDRWPERCLIFDTEVRTTMDAEHGYHALTFGIYRICVLVNGAYLCEREGIFYSGESDKGSKGLDYAPSAVLNKAELNAIGNFVSAELPDVEARSYPPRMKIEVYQTFTAFMEKIFWPAVRQGWLITCFNAPFDLSRLSRDWRKSRKGGFTLIMGHRFWRKSQTWIADPYRPAIRIDPKNARVAFISRGRVKGAEKHKGKWGWNKPGRFLDVGTLLFSLFDKHMGLDAWCDEHFKIPGKLKEPEGKPYTPSGRVTPKEISYCRNDVLITQRALNEAKREFNAHELLDLLPDKSYSPASIGKGYLRKLGIKRPSEKFSKFSAENQGIAMAAYFGGRAEVHIRRTKVPVMRLDFLSQYPTVNTLMGNWDVLTAESVSFVDCTNEARELLKTITVEGCFEREPWKQFGFFAKVKPDHDLFPVRAPYDPTDPQSLNIGSSFFTDEKAGWLAGPDVIAAKLLSGKVPHILKAYRLVPRGKQKGMQEVKLMGTIPVNPYEDDLFQRVIEHRKANEKNKALKHALKIIANSTSYGCFVELNEEKVSKPVKLEVYSGDERSTLMNIKETESPGSWYFPPLASLITSGGRLLLAMAETCVTAAGGTWLAADTDSILVVAKKQKNKNNWREVAGAMKRPGDYVAIEEGSLSEKEFAPIPALSWDKVKQISKRFESLNPYGFKGTILKIEDVNYQDDDSKKPLRTVYGYAISAKRYCLFTYEHGEYRIVDAKGHGLGFLRPPVENPKGWDKKWPFWIEEAWLYVLRNEMIIHKGENPEWLDLPAMMQIPISSPAVLGRLKNFAKPFDFVIAPIVSKARLDLEKQAEKPILITRYTKNSAEWLNATYYNVRTGKPCRITLGDSKDPNVVPVKSYRQVLNWYPYNPEHKSLAPGGQTRCDQYTRGILERDHVIADRHIPCGKEIKRKLDQGLIEHPDDSDSKSRVRVYERKVVAEKETRDWLSKLSERSIHEATGLDRGTIRLIKRGGIVKASTVQKITDFRRETENTTHAL